MGEISAKEIRSALCLARNKGGSANAETAPLWQDPGQRATCSPPYLVKPDIQCSQITSSALA